MRRLPLAPFVVLVIALSAPAEAKIYKWVMPDGTVKYSDQPQEKDAKELELPPLQIYSAPPPPPRTAKVPKRGGTSETTYVEFTVTSPADGETLRDNGGNVSVSLDLKPGLAGDHTVELIVDGALVGSGNSTTINLTNVDRGEHSVQAVVRDANGGELARTPAVTFYLKRASVN